MILELFYLVRKNLIFNGTLLLIFFCTSTHAQTRSLDSKSIIENLDSLSQRLPVEKIFIHTDKESYHIGDTIWFKSYLFEGGYLNASKKSELLYLELIDDSAEVVRRVCIKVKEGTGYAQIPLPKEVFHEGGYTIRAYTNWMKNFSNHGMYSKRFYLGTTSQNQFLVRMESTLLDIGQKEQMSVKLNLRESAEMPAGLRRVELNVKEKDKTRFSKVMETDLDGNLDFSFDLDDHYDAKNIRLEIWDLRPGSGNTVQRMPFPIDRPSKIDLQFLPEGGNLVADITNMMAFKAISEDGKGIAVSGTIYDKMKNVVSRFQSIHLGMGSFMFTPRIGESYTAELDTPLGATTIYKMPKVHASGTIMRVINLKESDSLRLEITASPDVLTSAKPFSIIASTRGIACYAQKLDWSRPVIHIPKVLFPTGIARISLLQEQNPVNERIAFIDHNDSFQVSAHPDKASYGRLDSVSLQIKVLDNDGEPVAGNFSLSVTDDSQVVADSIGNSSILTSILVNSEIKGSIENPGQYVQSKDPQVWNALDHLLLTQGWVGYDWNEVFNQPKEPLFQAEQSDQIRGRVIHDNGTPMPAASVLLKLDKSAQLLTTVTDQAGRFTFNQIPDIDTLSYFLQARTPKGKTLKFGRVHLQGFYPIHFSDTLSGRLQPDYINAGSKYLNYVKNANLKLMQDFSPTTGNMLEEVKITSKRINSFNRNGHGMADIVLEKVDLDKSTTNGLYQLLRQKLPGLRFKYTYTEGTPKGYCLYIGYQRVMIAIDHGEPSLSLGETPQALIDALNRKKIATMSSVEIMYSQKYLWKYIPPTVAKQFTPGETARIMEQYALAGQNPPTGEVKEYAVVQVSTLNKNGYKQGVDGTFRYSPLPVLRPKAFYSPRYSAHADKGKVDLRATVYWNPEILTDKNGVANVSFFTSSKTGTYTMVLNGTDFYGGLGRAETKLSVKIF